MPFQISRFYQCKKSWKLTGFTMSIWVILQAPFLSIRWVGWFQIWATMHRKVRSSSGWFEPALLVIIHIWERNSILIRISLSCMLEVETIQIIQTLLIMSQFLKTSQVMTNGDTITSKTSSTGITQVLTILIQANQLIILKTPNVKKVWLNKCSSIWVSRVWDFPIISTASS